MPGIVTVTGDRRTGKTELLLAMAKGIVRGGENVLYVSRTWADSRQAYLRLERGLWGEEPWAFFRSEGSERIEHDSGGTIRFTSTRSKYGGRGMTVDTLLLDEGVEYEHPSAKFVYRAKCSTE